jgi:hypothetical protein
MSHHSGGLLCSCVTAFRLVIRLPLRIEQSTPAGRYEKGRETGVDAILADERAILFCSIVVRPSLCIIY